MGWLIALGILVLLLILPLGVSAVYDGEGPRVAVLAGPLRIPVLPAKKKDKKQKPKKEKKKAAPKQKPAPKQTQEKNGGSLTDFLPLVEILLDFLSDFRRKLRVNVLELNLVLAGGDPSDLAINYGKATAALGNLWPRLEEWLVIKKRDVKIQCDFEGDKTLVTARLDLTITLGRLLAAVFKFLFKALIKFLQIMKKRKGGANNEPDVT